MAEPAPGPEQLADENDDCPSSVNYKPPAQKSVQQIQEMDNDDESLRKYKEALLGKGNVCSNPSAKPVEVTRMTLVCDSAPKPLVLDLCAKDQEKKTYILKEGVEYRIKISFKVNNEIVSGLKYVQQTKRKGVQVDKSGYMVGSYGPRAEEYEFLTPLEETPSGMLARGCYNISSKFTDDDKNDHLSWVWCLEIKKDWKD